MFSACTVPDAISATAGGTVKNDKAQLVGPHEEAEK